MDPYDYIIIAHASLTWLKLGPNFPESTTKCEMVEAPSYVLCIHIIVLRKTNINESNGDTDEVLAVNKHEV